MVPPLTLLIPADSAPQARFSRVLPPLLGVPPYLAPKMLGFESLRTQTLVKRRNSSRESRKSVRLQLAIPVFVRSKDGGGKDSLEFATALNISAGGALIVVRRSLPKSALISLEIPIVPVGPNAGLPNSSRVFRAKTVWVAHLDDYHLLGLKFAKPLHTNPDAIPSDLRKGIAAV